MVCGADPETRAAVIGKKDDIIILKLLNVNLRRHIHSILGGVTPSWIGIETPNFCDLVIQDLYIDSGVFCEVLKPERLQVFEMLHNEFRGQAIALAIGLKLGKEALVHI